MSTEVVMPQMGESIAEGTIIKWLKKVGDKIERDEPIFEMSTDKVDAEIPSPTAGILKEILVKEGQTVPVNAIVARIDGAENAATPPPASVEEIAPPPSISKSEPLVTPNKPEPAPTVSEKTSTDKISDVVMPQMGESIAEGTIIKWLKKVGDKVERDEPIFEISTDKVDAEIPSPVGGVLTEILVKEGQTVPVNEIVGRIASSEGGTRAPSVKDSSSVSVPLTTSEPKKPAETPQPSSSKIDSSASVEELRKIRSSPLVRKIAREHDVNISDLSGTGLSGRVTKNDILGYLEKGTTAQATTTSTNKAAPASSSSVAPVESLPRIPAYAPNEHVEIVPMSPMRKKISEHMVASRRTSAHVSSVFEVDVTSIMKMREQTKASFEQRNGTKLTVTPFIIRAVVEGLKAFPILNASVDGDNIVYKKDINIGIAVALDWGLIVPVVKHADEKNLVGLARTVNDLANRARSKQLKPDEVAGGTFTITNPGIFGSLFGTPIINQPQVAILGVGAIVKRPVVRDDDSIAIRSMVCLSISFDHRIIDGAIADQFMAYIKKTLESFQTTEL